MQQGCRGGILAIMTRFALSSRVVKFRRTGESARSEDDTASGEHEVQIEGVRAGLEAVELDDGAAVPKEFANPTDGGLCRYDVQLYSLGKHLGPVWQENSKATSPEWVSSGLSP
uniref:Uncharacterized protein n=2 Tax=Sus scrofa TaxID=9823 RepID=A0A8D1ZFX0_PIG